MRIDVLGRADPRGLAPLIADLQQLAFSGIDLANKSYLVNRSFEIASRCAEVHEEHGPLRSTAGAAEGGFVDSVSSFRSFYSEAASRMLEVYSC
jgi:hypothetical protein